MLSAVFDLAFGVLLGFVILLLRSLNGRGFDSPLLLARRLESTGIRLTEPGICEDRKSTRLNSSHWE